MKYSFSVTEEIKEVYAERIYTGNNIKRNYLLVSGEKLSFPIRTEKYEMYDIMENQNQLCFFSGYHLPVYFGTILVREYREEEKSYSKEEIKQKFEEKIQKFMQTMRLTSTAASVGYRYGEFGASSFTDSYSKDYTTSDTMVRNVVGEFEDGTILDVRANIDGGNRLTIKVIETKEDSNGKTYAEASEIYHEFEEPIIFSANEAKTANNMDSRDRMFIPYFTSADCNEIKLICISKSRYIKAKDQGIATTLTNKITNVKEVLSTKIDYEAETGTEIRIALSIDNNVTYKYFKNGSWATVTDKNMVKNGEGMTPQEFENLTNDNFKLLIGNNESIDIDVLVTLYTNDESATPKIKKISFKTSELLTE